MKMKTIVALCLSSFFVLTACQDKETAPTETSTNKTQTATPATSEATEAITTTEAPTAPTGEAPKLNPAHGQPFHRCDIAVGAPLDSPANTAQTAPPAPQAEGPKSFFKTVQSQQQADPKPAMNAAPSQAPVQTTQTTTTQSTPAQTAAAEANTPRPKNNPAHGQPHHRCEIKVGDPLPEI
jgi:hypothetical protein